jgi:hypothetical protein
MTTDNVFLSHGLQTGTKIIKCLSSRLLVINLKLAHPGPLLTDKQAHTYEFFPRQIMINGSWVINCRYITDHEILENLVLTPLFLNFSP